MLKKVSCGCGEADSVRDCRAHELVQRFCAFAVVKKKNQSSRRRSRRPREMQPTCKRTAPKSRAVSARVTEQSRGECCCAGGEGNMCRVVKSCLWFPKVCVGGRARQNLESDKRKETTSVRQKSSSQVNNQKSAIHRPTVVSSDPQVNDHQSTFHTSTVKSPQPTGQPQRLHRSKKKKSPLDQSATQGAIKRYDSTSNSEQSTSHLSTATHLSQRSSVHQQSPVNTPHQQPVVQKQQVHSQQITPPALTCCTAFFCVFTPSPSKLPF